MDGRTDAENNLNRKEFLGEVCLLKPLRRTYQMALLALMRIGSCVTVRN